MSSVTKLKTAPAKAAAFSAHFVLERETKGALRYMQVTEKGATTPFTIGEGAQIGSIYIRKTAFGKQAPKAFTLDVVDAE